MHPGMYEERGLFPLLPGGAPEMESDARPRALNKMSAKKMAQLVASKAGKAASAPNPTKPGSKPKKIPESAPRSLIDVIKRADPLPKGVGGPGPKKVRVRNRA